MKAKNVCLSLVNEHTTLCERGIVQLFSYPHPPKQYQTPWTSKTPPRIYSQHDTKRRLTRSSEDISNTISTDDSVFLNENLLSSPAHTIQSVYRNRSPNVTQSTDDGQSTMERSSSYHITVQKSQNQICLPKDYNPVAALAAVENMEIFLSQTFYSQRSSRGADSTVDCPELTRTVGSAIGCCTADGIGNSFTNRMFSETYEASLMMMKDSKRLHNVKHKNRIVRNSSRNYKHIIAENRYRELQTVGCIIVEIFLANKLRPLGGNYAAKCFDERVAACLSVLKHDFESLPKCVQYPVQLLFQLNSGNAITDKGLPPPSAQQILQPLLNNLLFPFPYHYAKVYTLIRSLVQFEALSNQLNYYTFFDCDGENCGQYEALDTTRVAFNRKIAECKVMACVIQIEALLEPIGYEQFNPIELILPHVIDLLQNDETSILAAWYLFDSIAIALGPTITMKHLLQPLLQLYDAGNNERISFLNSNFDSSMKFTTSSAFKSRKTIKLYHHSFLLRLMVRFGLKHFLENFVSPLIEAVGGYKETDFDSAYHYHCDLNRSGDLSTNISMKKSRSSKNFTKYDTSLTDSDTVRRVNTLLKQPQGSEEMFSFEESETDDSVAKVSMKGKGLFVFFVLTCAIFNETFLFSKKYKFNI